MTTRREILSAAAITAVLRGAEGMPASAVMERIFRETGATRRPNTVDTLKAGDASTIVKGIATSFAATLDVMQRASKKGLNLIVAHEPTFYNHLDQTDWLANDTVYAAKQAFVRDHGMVVYRFHDMWHARRPDGVMAGITRALGWEWNGAGQVFVRPETTLEGLASELKKKLEIRIIRVVGDPAMRLTKVAMLPGASGSAAHIKMLERDDVEALVIGEVPEWETVEYTRDAVTAGKRKGLVMLGHVPSEEGGMEECARWLRTFLTGLPIEFVPAGQPMWTVK